MRIPTLLLLSCSTLPLAYGQKDWPVYGHDPGGMRYSPLKQINAKNVAKLHETWTIDTQAPLTQQAPLPAGRVGAAGRGAPRRRGSESTPLVIKGVLYMATGYNRVLALEPDTGKKIWEYEGPHNPPLRGVSYWPGDAQRPPQIVFASSDGWLISLNAATGKLVPGFGNEGMVDMRKGFSDKFPNSFYGLSSPPTIYKDLAITGAHTQESPSLGPPGDIRAWDMKTGKLAWTFHTIPRPGEANHDAWQEDQWADRSGGNPWGIMTLDAERGMLFAGIGTPTRDFDGSDRKGSNLYGSSVIALDAATGKLLWYFQATHHDNWDYDLSAPPALIDVVRNGKRIPAVAQTSKQALLFILDRLTGKPIFGVEERPVPQDNPVPGDNPWPTQPFPLKPPPLSRNSFKLEEVAKITPEHEKFCRALLAAEGGALGSEPYSLYGPKLRVIFPSWIGGGNWGGVSFDPHLGYIFVNTQNLGNFNKMAKSENGQVYARVPPDDHTLGADSSLFINPNTHWPCQQPPWGELTAVNANTGEIAWKVPLGSYPELDKLGIPKTGVRNVGGSMVTAGGLVFIGATEDHKFRAFDSRTGKQLWETPELVDTARSAPITYEGKNGKQYVAIMAGGGNTGSTGPGRLYVYSLQ